MRRVVGMDIHRTFAEIVFWEGGRLRHFGRIDMSRAGLEAFGRGLEAPMKLSLRQRATLCRPFAFLSLMWHE
jgi:transposase